jgi:hypothetical protein
MQQKRFTDEQLYKLRNKIPFRVVAEQILEIPTKNIDGKFAFLCPKCNEFMTAVNGKTNLGRCWRCAVNFNTIEITMQSKHCSFVDSVKTLLPVLKAFS